MQYKIRGTSVAMPYLATLTPGETRLVFALSKVFPAERIFADCYFPKVDEGLEVRNVVSKADLVQVDVIVVDESGIYVFESKDYVGWIYGHGERVHWTQVSAYGKNKHQFYNPIRQNQAHLRALKAIVGEVPLYSVVVFGREAVLKVLENIPEDCVICTQNEVRRVLAKRRAKQRLTGNRVEDLCGLIKAGMIHPDGLVRLAHIEDVTELTREE